MLLVGLRRYPLMEMTAQSTALPAMVLNDTPTLTTSTLTPHPHPLHPPGESVSPVRG